MLSYNLIYVSYKKHVVAKIILFHNLIKFSSFPKLKAQKQHIFLIAQKLIICENYALKVDVM